MSYFRENIDKNAGYTPGFQPEQADVAKLNTNENPYPPSLKVIEAIASVSPEQLRRYPEPLANEFRKAAAKLHGLSENNIICTNGGDDLLTICLRAFCDKSRPVLYPVPTYSLYQTLAKLQDCKFVEIPFGIDYTLPAELFETGAALTIVCNPNAPTGSFIAPGKLKQLAEDLEGKGVLLIDEAYVDFAKSNCVDLVKTCDNVIILRSMSKGYSLAGLRFGYGIACEELITGLMKVKDSYNVDVIAIAAATAAIKDQKYFRTNVEKVKSERTRLTKELIGLGFNIVVAESQSNFILADSSLDAADIYDKLTDENIYVRYWSLPCLEKRLRITVGTKEDNDRLIDALKQIMRTKL